jgi:predicted RNase H-like HicB family nuclease
MPKYELIVWWSEEDDAYLVEVPELPYLMAHGTTYLEAVANAVDAIKGWLEIAHEQGLEIPAPRRRPVPA